MMVITRDNVFALQQVTVSDGRPILICEQGDEAGQSQSGDPPDRGHATGHPLCYSYAVVIVQPARLPFT